MQEQNLKVKFLPCSVGEAPILVRIKENDWAKDKSEVLRHCISLLDNTEDSNIILLHEKLNYFPDMETRTLIPDIESELKKITNKLIVTHNPLPIIPMSIHNPIHNLQEKTCAVQRFGEKNNQTLVACAEEFKGCEASNVIHVRFGEDNFIDSWMRRVPNLVCIQVLQGLETLGNIYNLTRFADRANMNGIKEDNTFYSP